MGHLTEQEIHELLALHEKATPGPWDVGLDPRNLTAGPHWWKPRNPGAPFGGADAERAVADAALIVAMRNALPALCDLALEALKSDELTQLQALVDEACTAACDDADCGADAVNWADLSCVSAEHYSGTAGEGLRVWIAEAAPDASSLQQFVRRYLARRGFDVEVMTEW